MVLLVVINFRAPRFKSLLIHLIIHCHICIDLVEEVRVDYKFELIILLLLLNNMIIILLLFHCLVWLIINLELLLHSVHYVARGKLLLILITVHYCHCIYLFLLYLNHHVVGDIVAIIFVNWHDFVRFKVAQKFTFKLPHE